MSETLECRGCDAPVPRDALFCPQCGEGTAASDAATPHDRLRDRLTRAVGHRYEVGEVLGAGGMGVVYLAHDLTDRRKVAIKVLSPELAADAKIVERFGREARTASALHHPGIVRIHEAGSQRGLHYFVMQYVAGKPLDEILRDQPVASIAFATRVLREAAAALAHAHRQGVVHRDVKPENIIIDADGRVLLADFGISKVVDTRSDATTMRKLTQTGGIVGTPHYMAPEHALGHTVDGRTDQYALAVVGFQMLAGRLPFDDETLPGIIHLHINTAAPRLSSLRPELPTHLAAAIARAMSKAPMHRFATMEDFAAAVAGPSAQRPAARFAAAMSLLVLVALAGGAFWARRSGWTMSRLRAAAGATATASAPAQRELARFDVSSSPRATLYIDGRRIGMTPIVDGRLSVGVHEIRLERSGYRTLRDTITVTPARNARHEYVLRPRER